jgi:tetratricopeptide (TPR) repeat protein
MMIDLRFHRWDTLLATPQPERDRAFSRAFWRYARAMALAAQGKARDAAAEQRRFERERAAVPAEAQYLGNNKASGMLALAAATLEAQLAAARGDVATSITAWLSAVTLEAALQYDEPPAWFYPVRQSLGAALLRAGDHAGAERVFREALATHPRDGRLLYGLSQTLQAQGRAGEAQLVQQQFARAWRGAPMPLTLDDL